MTRDSGALTWQVLKDDAARSQWGGPRPKDTLVIERMGEYEYLRVPRQVANAIQRDPSLRNARFNSRGNLFEQLDCTSRSVAKSYCLQLLQKREYARQELLSKLADSGYSKDVRNDVVTELERANLVSDMRFAEVFVRSKLFAGWGLRRIERELVRRGVSLDKLEGWPHAFVDEDGELERAVDVARRKHVRPPNEYAKLVRFLVGRGFAQRVAMDAARSVLEDEHDHVGEGDPH